MFYGGLNVTVDQMCIGRATSTWAAGPYQDDGGAPLCLPPLPGVTNYGVIDPSVFVDNDGTAFLLYKRNQPGTNTSMYAQNLDADGKLYGGSWSSEIFTVDAGQSPAAPWESYGASSFQTEQPEMVYRNGQYLFFYSGNWHESNNYAIGYAVCATVRGPCERRTTGNSPWMDGVASTHTNATFHLSVGVGPGAANFVVDPAGATWMAHHAWYNPLSPSTPTGGRAFYIQKMTFANGPALDPEFPVFATQMVDLDPGNVLGGADSAGLAINDRGDVAGNGRRSDGLDEPLWWDQSFSPTRLGGGYPVARPGAIDNANLMTGYIEQPLSAGRAVQWAPPLLPLPTSLTPLVPGPNSWTRANDANETGLRVGAATGAGTGIVPTFWDAGGSSHRLFLDGSYAVRLGESTAVNESNAMVGWTCDGLCLTKQAFMKPLFGGTAPLGSLGGSEAIPSAINNADKVVGQAMVANGKWHAFLWDHGLLIDLQSLIPGAVESYATDINDFDQVVGWYTTASGQAKAFLIVKNGLFVNSDLGDLGGGQSKAFAISNRGLITGTSRTASGQWHAFLRGVPDREQPSPVVPADGTPSPVMLPTQEVTIWPPSSGYVCVSSTVTALNGAGGLLNWAWWALWIMESTLYPLGGGTRHFQTMDYPNTVTAVDQYNMSPGPWVFALREVEGVIGSWSVAVTMGPCS